MIMMTPYLLSRHDWGTTEYKIIRNWTPREERLARVRDNEPEQPPLGHEAEDDEVLPLPVETGTKSPALGNSSNVSFREVALVE